MRFPHCLGSTRVLATSCSPLVSPAGTPRTRGNWAREPCYVVWRVGFNFDGSHACCLEHASQNSGFPAKALRASHLSVCDGKEAVPGEVPEGDRGPRARAGPNQRAARDRLRTRSPRTPRDGPGSGSALRPAACTPSRSPARPGIFRQATELTKPQCGLFTARAIDPPKRIQELAATR